MQQKQTGMIATFRSLKGNPRACIWTEPLWGIPYNLYLPFASLYMEALGLSKGDIGLVASISIIVQVFASILSGPLADKMGRRRCTLYVDLLCWSVPTLLWMCAQNMLWFIAASFFTGFYRVTQNSWQLLMTEAQPSDLVVRCFSLSQFMGLLAAFFTPLSAMAVNAFGLVPTVRVLYGIAFVMMTAKFLTLYFMSTETEMGERRMVETANESISSMIVGCKAVFLEMIREPKMMYTIGILSVFQCVTTLNNSFWALYLVDRMGIDAGKIALLITLRSLTVLFCVLVLGPRLHVDRFKRPMLYGYGLFIASQAMLLIRPSAHGLLLLLPSVLLEGVALSILSPMGDSLLIINADPVERARILGLVLATMLLPITVFPALAGWLAESIPAAPLIMNILFLFVGAVLALCLARVQGPEAT